MKQNGRNYIIINILLIAILLLVSERFVSYFLKHSHYFSNRIILFIILALLLLCLVLYIAFLLEKNINLYKSRLEEKEKLIFQYENQQLILNKVFQRLNRVGVAGIWEYNLEKRTIKYMRKLPTGIDKHKQAKIFNLQAIIDKFIYPGNLLNVESIIRKLEQLPQSVFFEVNTHINTKDRVFMIEGELVLTNQTPEKYIGFIQDITELKKNEASLKSKITRYEALIHSSPGGIAFVDFSGKFIFINISFVRLFGYKSVAEFLSVEDDIRTLIPLKFGVFNPQDFNFYKREQINKQEQILRDKNKKEFPAEIMVRLLFNEEDQPDGYLFIVNDITERNQIIEIIQNSEQQFRTIFEFITSGLCIYSTEWQIVLLNKAIAQLFGYRKDEFFSLEAYSYIHSDYRENFSEQIKLIKDEEYVRFETKAIRKNQSVFDAEVIITYIILNETKHYLLILTDISDRKIAENALMESEKKYRSLIENLPVGLEEIDLNRRITYVNNWFCNMFGYSRDELIGKDFMNFVDIKDNLSPKKALVKLNQIVKEQPKPIPMFQKIVSKDGETVDTRIDWNYKFDTQKKLIGIIITVSDISRQKKAETKLRQSEKKFALMFNSSPDANLMIDIKDLSIIDVNQSFIDCLGYQRDELIGNNMLDMNLCYEGACKQLYNKIIINSRIQNFEIQFIRKNGEERIFLNSSEVLQIEGNKYILAINRDITERKEAEKKIQLSEQKFSKIFSTTPIAIGINSFEDFTFLEVNESFEKYLEYPKEQVIGKLLSELDIWLHPDDREKFITKYHEEMEIQDLELQLHSRTGKILTFIVSSQILFIEEGKRVLTYYKNITEIKQIERKVLNTIIQTEEKERKRFAEDLHDEIGPFLSGMLLYVNELGSDSILPAEKKNLLEYVNQMIDEAISNTRTISHNLMPSLLSDYGLINAIKSFCQKINATKTIEIKFTSNNKSLRYDRMIEIILYRIIIELINNTIKHARASRVIINIEEKNNRLELYYSDNGIGFDLNKVLSTDKGLGLNNIVSRLNSINGKYRFNTQPGSGFTLFIEINLNQFSTDYKLS